MWLLMEGWLLFRERKSVTTSRDNHTRSYFIAAVAAALLTGFLLSGVPLFRIGGNGNYRFCAAVAVIWAGILLRAWSVMTLGQFFRTTVMTQRNQPVIDYGPYRFVRHPSYAAIVLLITGVGIGLGNAVGLAVMEAVVFWGINRRIAVEERELVRSLGKNYQIYMGKTKKIIPFLY